VMSSNVTEV